MKEFLDKYFDEYRGLAFPTEIYPTLIEFQKLAEGIKAKGNKLMIGGNGASASISSHGAVDFTKQGGVRAITFNEAGLITCFANDFGYENWLAEAVQHYANAGDALVLVSVSGTSPNVVEAAKRAKELDLKVVTFTGRDDSNPLKAQGDINFWVDSHSYNIVECIHMVWLTTVIDMVIGKSVYETSKQ